MSSISTRRRKAQRDLSKLGGTTWILRAGYNANPGRPRLIYLEKGGKGVAKVHMQRANGSWLVGRMPDDTFQKWYRLLASGFHADSTKDFRSAP